MKIFLYSLAIILSNFTEIDRSANILRVFFNRMSKGQVDVMHNRGSSGDQVARVTRYKYFFPKCSRIVSITTADKNIILNAYSTQKVGSGGNLRVEIKFTPHGIFICNYVNTTERRLPYFDTKMLYYCHKNYPVKLAYYTT